MNRSFRINPNDLMKHKEFDIFSDLNVDASNYKCIQMKKPYKFVGWLGSIYIEFVNDDDALSFTLGYSDCIFPDINV